MASSGTQELLQDARLVIDYAIRIGRLPDDTLPKAVSAIESAPTGGTPQEAALLAVALNNTIRAIAPMTLAELQARRNPRNRRITKILQVSFCILTIGLTVVVAGLTEYLHREETVLRTLKQLQDTHPLDKLNALRKMVKLESVLSKKDPIHYDEYHRGVRELRDLQEQLSGTYIVLSTVAKYPPWYWLFGGQRNTSSSGSDSKSGLYSNDATSASTKNPNAPPATYAEALGKFADLTDKSAAAKSSGADECDPNAQEFLKGLKDYAPWVKEVVFDLLEEVCFQRKLQLLLDLPPTSIYFYGIQANMNTLNGWVLPFFYGLLGACVFVMRDLLDPRSPTLGPAPAVLRVALGGIAGIIIGWFSVSTGAKSGEIAAVSAVPFALAFLAGFSIDILFSLLDRLNRTITDQSTGQRPA